MPVLYQDLWVTTTTQSTPMHLRGVWGLHRGSRILYTSTYRDLPRLTYGTLDIGSGTTTVATIPAKVPLIGAGEAPGATDALLRPQLRMPAPDDALHIPPRYRPERMTGYVIQLSDASPVLTETEAPQLSYAVTVDATANTFTLASGTHELRNGDQVAVMATTVPTGITVTQIYEVIVNTSSSVLLRLPGGAIADPTAAGAGVRLVLVSRPPDPQTDSGIIFVPDAWDPHFHFTDPLA